jgi:uncharacterized membrane protein YozB (DUF420 family)
MIELSTLPTLNAMLNSIAFVLLIAGRRFIRQGRVTAHKRCMLAAFGTSVLFLASYLTYRVLGEDKRFGGAGWIRPVYFFILITHVVLAATVPFLASYTLYQALKGRFDRHRRVARVTYPIWIYVSVTGVVVYVMLFRVFRPVGDGM